MISVFLSARRARTSARKVKCATSRYPANPTSEHPLTSQNVTSLCVEILSQPPPSGAHGRKGQRNRILQIMRTEPYRPWHARELSVALAHTHYDSLCVQLGRWAREGLLDKTANATYRLAADCIAPPQPLTPPPRP